MISSNYRNRLARQTPTPAPAPPPDPDFIVSGTLTPDATGNYFAAGIYEGETYYEREDSAFVLWFQYVDPGPFWIWNISQVLGVELPLWWTKIDFAPALPPGDYVPEGTATGTATVSAA